MLRAWRIGDAESGPLAARSYLHGRYLMRKTAKYLKCPALMLALSVPVVAQNNASESEKILNVGNYCSSPGKFDDSCFRNALAALSAGSAITSLQVPRGTYQISSLNISTPNVSFRCLPGAILQPTKASNGIRVSASQITFDGCELDMGNIDSAPGLVATKASGFVFRNGSITNINSQPGLLLSQSSDAIVDRNHFVTQGTGDAVMAYGPTKNIRITNNFGIGSSDVISGRNANGSTSGVVFSGNVLQPVANKTILTTGDFSNGFGPASPITNIVITRNTCNIVARSASVAPFGCFSLVGSYDLTFSGNTMNATGQYVGNSLLELGTSRSTVSENVFNTGNDPGAQHYDGIVVYTGDIALSRNVFAGASAYGDSIHIYPQSNANGIAITGGSIDAGNTFGAQIISQASGTGYSGDGTCAVNGGVYKSQARCAVAVTKAGGLVFAMTYAGQYSVAPVSITTSLTTRGNTATVIVGRARNQAIVVACNQGSIPLRVTGIAGSGPAGPVTSVAVYESPGANAPVGTGFSATSGISVTGGSGSGLKLDILGVDLQGGIASLGVTPGSAGEGYKVGDTVNYKVSNSEIAASASGLTISGLAISGALFHAVDIEGFQGPWCPVSASLENVAISGPDATTEIVTGIYQRNASVKLSGIEFNHVTGNTDGNR
jgi:hypothetical protein